MPEGWPDQFFEVGSCHHRSIQRDSTGGALRSPARAVPLPNHERSGGPFDGPEVAGFGSQTLKGVEPNILWLYVLRYGMQSFLEMLRLATPGDVFAARIAENISQNYARALVGGFEE